MAGIAAKAQRIGEILDSKRARDIIVIDIAHRTIIADYFVICSARSTSQVQALADEVQGVLAEDGITPRRIEGYSAARWVVLDYGDIFVHIFHEEERAFYNLERLWMEEGHYNYISTKD